MEAVSFDLRRFLRRRDETLQGAAAKMRMHQSALSVLLLRYRLPTKTEEEKLIESIGRSRYVRFFGKPRFYRAPKLNQQQDEEKNEAVNE
jgi:hypothetical protein